MKKRKKREQKQSEILRATEENKNGMKTYGDIATEGQEEKETKTTK